MTELAITVDGFVNVFKLKRRGRRYACPACGLDFDIIESGGVSGHCRNKSCLIYGYGRRGVGWAHLIGVRIWECSEAEAIERVLRVCPPVVSDVGRNESSVANHTGVNRRVRALELVKERLGG